MVSALNFGSKGGSGGVVAVHLISTRYGNQDKLRRCGPLGSCADFTCSLLLPHKLTNIYE